jgi:hypothetical protein
MEQHERAALRFAATAKDLNSLGKLTHGCHDRFPDCSNMNFMFNYAQENLMTAACQ